MATSTKPPAATSQVAGKKAAKSVTPTTRKATPAAKPALNPAGTWPFPTGARPK